MKIAYFDCQFGAAGDMLVSSLLASGLNESQWRNQLRNLALPQGTFTVEVKNVLRASINAKYLHVVCSEEKTERHLSDIEEIIDRSAISDKAKRLARAIFHRLGEAEAHVHGVSVDAVHFHEVGAVDASVDIVGFAIGLDLLGIESCCVSPLPLGQGTVATEHGRFPVPGPAVVRLLSQAGAPVAESNIDFECLTPTGAAILVSIADAWGQPPSMDSVINTGFGAGHKDTSDWPNVVRLITGTKNALPGSGDGRFRHELVEVVEANLDDTTPQALSFAVDRLFDAGALDVAVIPALMKKGRSGHLLSVICPYGASNKFKELILTETTSLGVRSYQAARLVADRYFEDIELSRGGKVKMKVATDRHGRTINAQPEFEDCAAYATTHGITLKEVIAEAQARYAGRSASPGK